MAKFDIVIVANSPGELSSLVKPVAEEFAKKTDCRVILVLTPCQYSSGKEIEFVRRQKSISELITPPEYKDWVIFNRRPKRINFGPKGVVFFIGGDLAHAMIIAKKLKYPAYAYLNELIAWKSFYKKFYVSDELTYKKLSRRLPVGKMEIVGDLMVDSVTAQQKWAPEKNVITFLPGSRQWIIDFMLPLYKELMNLLKKEDQGLKFQLVSSPFIRTGQLEGTEIIEFDQANNSELAVTIPGTNTANLATRGIPMIMLFPLNRPDSIPLEGIPNLIGKIPVLGRMFKKFLAGVVNRKVKYFALPNQKADQEIVPEIRGDIDLPATAQKIILLLKDRQKRERMSKELMTAMGQPGAAARIVKDIYGQLQATA